MVIAGHIHNGVVVLEGDAALPEGAVVAVSYLGHAKTKADEEAQTVGAERRIEVPLVRTGQPGSVRLTGRQIAEILDEGDAGPRH